MFDTLNDEQQAVVDFDGGPLRVIAGAGTGKTTALTARVGGLIERGIRARPAYCCSPSPAAPPVR